jgi:hypothetical protein
MGEKEVEWKRSYRQKIRDILDKYVKPEFGEKGVSDIVKADLLKYRAKLAKVTHGSNTLSASRINQIMNVIKQILDEAADRYEFSTPFQGIKPLQRWIDTCPVPELAHFISQVFSDRELTTAFFTRPASERHHHAWPGGLAEHSLEVASRVETMLAHVTEQERWLASAAGLLHDLGKIRTHQDDGRRTATGYVMKHEELTLELIAPALKSLDKSWPDGANALRYLLVGMTKAAAEKRPWLPSLMVVQVADRMSAAEDARRQAFVNRPDWQRFATLDVPGSPSRFWIPKAPLSKQFRSCEMR